LQRQRSRRRSRRGLRNAGWLVITRRFPKRKDFG
jgi:hypothetical protein